MKTVHHLNTRIRPVVGAVAMAMAGLLALNLSGCEDASGKAAESAAATGAVVSAATVIQKAVVETQEFSGRMEAIERVDIRARVPGFITSVNITPGAIVKKGDVLFVIDPRPYQAEADRTEAAAAAARAKVELARIELTRSQKLIGEKAIAQRELDENTSNFKQLEASARAAAAEYDNARLNLSYTRVTSPIDGRVGKADITLGNLVDTSAVLTKVVSDDKIYASFDGDEDTYLRVGAAHHSGQDVNVRVGLANEQGFPHEGKLEFVDNQLDPQTGGVRMRAIFTNADKTLAPGLFARVQLQGGTHGGNETQAILINERAIGTDQDRKFVFVVDAQGKAEYRQVTLGNSVDGLRVVRTGLKAGEQIVVNGLVRVMPGAPLAPHTVSMDFNPDEPVAETAADTASKTRPDAKSKG
ncbi:efflux RND transporter periplasmic adaptor subunit [Pseudomonas sp. NPDC090208]|uniref:efflux RND transporter periplasmic adaptor subunit n=1 Tax=Pseudomonas sp. NPDC090208 TaxID=3364478 RepID=UPI00380E7077